MYSGEENLRKAVDAGIVEGATLVESPDTDAQGSAQEEQQGFSIEKALDTPGFAEFVASAKDSEQIDMQDPWKISEMYDAFRDMNTATGSIQGFLKENEAFRAISIDFGQGALPGAVAEHIRDMAHEQPEALAQLANTLTEYTDIKNAIESAEQSLLDLQGNVESGESLRATLDELRGRQSILNDAHKVSGFFARKIAGIKAAYENFAFKHSVEHEKEWLATHEGEPGGGHTRAGLEAFVEERSTARRLNDARLIVRDYYNIEIEPGAIKAEIADVERSIQAMEGRIATHAALEQLKEQHRDNLDILNTLIIQTVSTNKNLQQLAWRQVEAKVVSMAKNPDAAFDYIEKVRSGAGALMFDSKNVEKQTAEWANIIQTSVEAAVNNEIERAFSGASLGSKAFSNLEQSLSSFIEKSRIGQKEGVDARAFVMSTLKKLIERNKSNPKLRAKNILLQALISKFSGGTRTAEAADAPEAIPLTPDAPEAEASTEADALTETGPETEQGMSHKAETLLSEIMNFSEEDKRDGLPRVMEEINRKQNRPIAQEVMQSDGFIDICIKILSGKWAARSNKMPYEDVSVRHFTQLMAEFPSDTFDAVLKSTDYLMAVTKELTTEKDTGDLRYAAEIFGPSGIEQFPSYVQDMLRTDERFLDAAVDSLRIPEYSWDFRLMAVCLEDVGEDFKDAVFSRPRFIQIFSDFLNGSYRSNKDEDVAEGVRALAPILGEKFMKNKEIKKIVDSIKAAPASQQAETKAEPKKPEKAQKPEEPKNPRAETPIPEDDGYNGYNHSSGPYYYSRNDAPGSRSRPQQTQSRETKKVIDVTPVEAVPPKEQPRRPRQRGPIIDAEIVENAPGPAQEQSPASQPLAIEENSALAAEMRQGSAPKAEAQTVETAAPQETDIPVTAEFGSLEEMLGSTAPSAPVQESAPAVPEAEKPAKPKRAKNRRPSIPVTAEFSSLEDMIEKTNPSASPEASENKGS